jgi:hypothetical protein
MSEAVALHTLKIGSLAMTEMTRRKLKLLAKSIGSVRVRWLDENNESNASPNTMVIPNTKERAE